MKVKFPKKMSKILSNTKHLIFLFLFSFGSFSQSDSIVLNEIYKTSLTHGKTYEWLDFLSNQIGKSMVTQKIHTLSSQIPKRTCFLLILQKIPYKFNIFQVKLEEYFVFY